MSSINGKLHLNYEVNRKRDVLIEHAALKEVKVYIVMDFGHDPINEKQKNYADENFSVNTLK